MHRNKVVPKAHTNGMIEKGCESTGTLRSQVGVWTCRSCCCCRLQHGPCRPRLYDFSSHIWYIIIPAANFSFFFCCCFFFLGGPSTYGSLCLNAIRNSNKSDMQELWWRMLHTRRTACMADARLLSRSLACGTISAKRRSDASRIWSWVSKSGKTAF